MERGFSNLKDAVQNQSISKYHILASISSFHCSARNFESTDWTSILRLYDQLLTLDYSPTVALNHAIALSKTGKTYEALEELKTIENHPTMKSNYLFYATKAGFEMQINQQKQAKDDLVKAIENAPLDMEKSS